MSKLINPTQGPNGLTFGHTAIKATNVSARAIGYGQCLVADQSRTDADTSSATPGIAGSLWSNWRDIPAETGTDIRRYCRATVGVVLDEIAGGVPDNGQCNLLIEGFIQAYAMRTAAEAGVGAHYASAGSPLSLEYLATNANRYLVSGIQAQTAAGAAGPMKPVGILCTYLDTTGSTTASTVVTSNTAEGAGPIPYVRGGAVGTCWATALYGQANAIKLCEVLFQGVFGF